MTMNLKRLWDTENKKIVWAIPTGDPHKKLQVWVNEDGSKLYVYDIAGWREIAQSTVDAKEYGPVWKDLADETVGYYLTNVPTNLYNRDSGDEVAYRFMNGTTVLQSGKVDEGETPEYTGETPTKSATAQYTYTFSGWKPAVGPISKKTDYKAQFTSEVNEYTVSIISSSSEIGEVDEPTVSDVPYGTAITENGDTLTIGETTITATSIGDAEFVQWGIDTGESYASVPATVTGNLEIVAVFQPGEPGPQEPDVVWQQNSSSSIDLYLEDQQPDTGAEYFFSNVALADISYYIDMEMEGFVESDAVVTITDSYDDDYPYSFTFAYNGNLDDMQVVDGDEICRVVLTSDNVPMGTATITYQEANEPDEEPEE